jgi:hypothetical protein
MPEKKNYLDPDSLHHTIAPCGKMESFIIEDIDEDNKEGQCMCADKSCPVDAHNHIVGEPPVIVELSKNL